MFLTVRVSVCSVWHADHTKKEKGTKTMTPEHGEKKISTEPDMCTFHSFWWSHSGLLAVKRCDKPTHR